MKNKKEIEEDFEKKIQKIVNEIIKIYSRDQPELIEIKTRKFLGKEIQEKRITIENLIKFLEEKKKETDKLIAYLKKKLKERENEKEKERG